MAQHTMSSDQRYRCKVSLDGIESWAGNARVQQEFEALGFKDVVVQGGGSVRVAEGTWTGANIAVEIPAQISDIEEINDPNEEDDKDSDEEE